MGPPADVAGPGGAPIPNDITSYFSQQHPQTARADLKPELKQADVDASFASITSLHAAATDCLETIKSVLLASTATENAAQAKGRKEARRPDQARADADHKPEGQAEAATRQANGSNAPEQPKAKPQLSTTTDPIYLARTTLASHINRLSTFLLSSPTSLLSPSSARLFVSLSRVLSTAPFTSPSLSVLSQSIAIDIYRLRLPSSPESNSSYELDGELASALNELAFYLVEGGGRKEAALEAVEEAVRMRRELVNSEGPDPGRGSDSEGDGEGGSSRRGLAYSLATLAECLQRLGRVEEAIEAGREALAILREEAVRVKLNQDGEGDEGIEAPLIDALLTLSSGLSSIGRFQEAVDVAEEALLRADTASEVLDQESKEQTQKGTHEHETSDAYMTDLTTSTHRSPLSRNISPELLSRVYLKLSLRLASLPHIASAPGALPSQSPISNPNMRSAQRASQNSVRLARLALTTCPTLIRPAGELALANALTNQSSLQIVLHDPAKALLGLQEALAIYRSRAQSPASASLFPLDGLEPLAETLTSAALALRRLGRTAEARSATDEAVEVLRKLADAYPDVGRPKLAQALCNAYAPLAEAGDIEEAVAHLMEACDVWRELLGPSPSSGSSTVSNGDKTKTDTDAEAEREEGMKAVWMLGMAQALESWAEAEGEMGKWAEAAARAKEARETWEALGRAEPDEEARAMVAEKERRARERERVFEDKVRQFGEGPE